MPRSSSAEPSPKQSKRKGTRSVSTLTPTQLARKRANDREAQRAIRARTKEHIERLERELADLKSGQNRDRTVQDLLRRNRALEEELSRLREHIGITVSSSPYSAPTGTPRTLMDDMYLGQLTPSSSVYDDNLSSGSGAVSSPRMSPLPSGEYVHLPEYGHAYGAAMSSGCETWASSIATNPILPAISSPPSPGNCDDYSAGGYIPTSVSAVMMPARPRVGGMSTKEIKMDYEGLDNNVTDAAFRLSGSSMPAMPPAYVQQPPHHPNNNSASATAPTSNINNNNPSSSVGSHHPHPHQNNTHGHSHNHSHSNGHQHPQLHQAQPSFPQAHAQPPHQRPDQWNMYPMFYQGHFEQRVPSTTCVSR